jgi:hypothetical protein
MSTKRSSRTVRGAAVVGVLALIFSGLALVAPGATAAAPYAVTLAASSTSLAVGGTVTLTATANQNVGPTPYGLSIVNSTTGVVLTHVGTGTTTSVTVTETSPISQSFVGRIDSAGGSPIAATSSPVTVTWASQSQAPAFSADAATSSATVGSSYSYTYAATGSPAPTFSVTSGTIPPGLTLTSSTGVLSGVPTTAGTYTFVVGASNSAGTAPGTTQTIVVAPSTVSGYAVTLAASSTSLAVGGTVTLTATANQNVGPTPYGLSIVNSTTGVVLTHVGTGTTTSVTVTETSPISQSFVGRIDSAGGSPIAATSSPVTVTWASQSQAPAFSADAATSSATVGSSYSYTYAATGSPAPTFSVTSGTIPPGLTLTSSTGVLSGVPTTAGTYTFVVGASNSAGTAPGTTQTIVVAPSTSPPLTITRAASFPVTNESTELSSLSVDPQKVGDLMVVSAQLHSTSISVTSVSGGGSSGWTRAEQFVDTANDLTYMVWYAVVTKVGPATVTVSYSGSTSLPVELFADSYTTNTTASWHVVSAGGASTPSVSAKVNWPALKSGATGAQMYWGASEEHGTGTGGSSAGFAYYVSPEGNQFLDDTALATSTTYQPVSGVSPSGVSTAVGVIFAAQ